MELKENDTKSNPSPNKLNPTNPFNGIERIDSRIRQIYRERIHSMELKGVVAWAYVCAGVHARIHSMELKGRR